MRIVLGLVAVVCLAGCPAVHEDTQFVASSKSARGAPELQPRAVPATVVHEPPVDAIQIASITVRSKNQLGDATTMANCEAKLALEAAARGANVVLAVPFEDNSQLFAAGGKGPSCKGTAYWVHGQTGAQASTP